VSAAENGEAESADAESASSRSAYFAPGRSPPHPGPRVDEPGARRGGTDGHLATQPHAQAPHKAGASSGRQPRGPQSSCGGDGV
jgi:hypothetical protein